MRYQVLCCGSNGNYQLGISHDIDQNGLNPAFFEIDGRLVDKLDSKPIKIRSGGNHTFVLLETGELFSCGQNTYGQCGHSFSGEMEHLPNFKLVDHREKWKEVSCGWEFSILQDFKDNLYVCGLGLKGELGMGPKVTRCSFRPSGWKPLAPITTIKSSLSHTIVRLENGEFYGFGNCRKGQLGQQEPQQINDRVKPRGCIWEPEKLTFNDSLVIDFSLGREFTVTWHNDNTYRIHGKDNKVNQLVAEILDVKTMWSSSHFLVKDLQGNTDIVSLGNNSHGQLFPRNTLNTSNSIAAFEIGSEHGLVLLSDNSVWAWGWGEHGNCGQQAKPKSSEDELSNENVTFDYLNCLYKDKNPVILIGAGCATSWVVTQVKDS